jgi:hypothetical protein
METSFLQIQNFITLAEHWQDFCWNDWVLYILFAFKMERIYQNTCSYNYSLIFSFGLSSKDLKSLNTLENHKLKIKKSNDAASFDSFRM